MDVGLIFPLLMAAGSIGGGAFIVLSRLEDRKVMRETLSSIDSYDLESGPQSIREEKLAESIGTRALLPAFQAISDLGRRLTPMGYADKVRLKFVYAGLHSPDAVDRFLAKKSILVPLGIVAAIGNLFIHIIPGAGIIRLLVSVFLLAAISLYPDIKLSRLVDERQSTILRSLPDVLDLLTISVEAGLGFEQALDRVIDAVPGPLSDEFARMLGESRAGASRSDAMRAMDERVNIPELRSFVLAIIQADTFGVSIGRVLRAQSEEMRIKRRQLAQEKAQKAPVKMLIPMVFCIFPALFVVVLGPAALNIRESFGS
jgi:tight adherence protein C